MPTTTLSEDLVALRALKADYDAKREAKNESESDFRRGERAVYDRMEEEGTESQRVDGTTFSPVEQTYHQIQDRRAFIEWELARWRDSLAAVISEAIGYAAGVSAELAADAAIEWTLNGPELIQWKEVGDVLNALVRQRMDDDEELPPGVSYRLKQYVAQRGSG